MPPEGGDGKAAVNQSAKCQSFDPGPGPGQSPPAPFIAFEAKQASCDDLRVQFAVLAHWLRWIKTSFPGFQTDSRTGDWLGSKP